MLQLSCEAQAWKVRHSMSCRFTLQARVAQQAGELEFSQCSSWAARGWRQPPIMSSLPKPL